MVHGSVEFYYFIWFHTEQNALLLTGEANLSLVKSQIYSLRMRTIITRENVFLFAENFHRWNQALEVKNVLKDFNAGSHYSCKEDKFDYSYGDPLQIICHSAMTLR